MSVTALAQTVHPRLEEGPLRLFVPAHVLGGGWRRTRRGSGERD